MNILLDKLHEKDYKTDDGRIPRLGRSIGAYHMIHVVDGFVDGQVSAIPSVRFLQKRMALGNQRPCCDLQVRSIIDISHAACSIYGAFGTPRRSILIVSSSYCG